MKHSVKKLFIAAVAGFSSITACASEVRGNYQFSMAYNTQDNFTQKIENIFNVEAENSFDAGIRLFGSASFYHESKDLLEPGQPDQASVSNINRRKFFGDHGEASVRELFVDGYIGDTFYRLGKQQVVWGQADGLQVLDVVNPQNFREFIYHDQEDRRLPLWTANIEIPIDDWTAQLLWIPDQSYHQVPSSQDSSNLALYQFSSPYLVPQIPSNLPVSLEKLDKPDHWFKDSDWGIKASAFIKGWDISLNYFYHTLDSPQVRQSISNGTLIISPSYQQSQLLGGSLSNAFGNITLRAEAAYSTGKFFYLKNPGTQLIDTTQGGITSDEVSTVAGLDYNGLGNTLISGQLFTSVIFESENLLFRDKTENQISLLLRRDFFNTTLHTDLLAIHSLNNNDGSIQAKVTYEWRSNIEFTIGADLAYGDGDGLFGQFDHLDVVYLTTEINF